MKYEIGQDVFICVNPLHMDVIENSPIVDGKIERIRKTILITEEGESEKIEYNFEALCFERWMQEDEIFKTYDDAAKYAKIIIPNILKKRLAVNSKIEQALSEV
ncbi:hypothetical protein [Methylobacter marinus]|uniref:hypothetical protein n=1 Tax=Methylobacter marinus TaxID=34058 RepID=UPI000360E26B|nr:hypothetical protein [Methylobacter marinus]